MTFGEKCARGRLLVLKHPVADFKDERGKRGIVQNLPPLAEGLHEPGNLPRIPSMAKAVAIVPKRPLDRRFIQLRKPVPYCGGKRQQNLPGKVILKALFDLVESEMSLDTPMTIDGRPKRIGQPAYLSAAIVAGGKLAQGQSQHCYFRNGRRVLAHLQPYGRLT